MFSDGSRFRVDELNGQVGTLRLVEMKHNSAAKMKELQETARTLQILAQIWFALDLK